MSCEVSNADSAFNDSWFKNSQEEQGGLGAIAEFNESFEGKTVDPQLTFSNPSTPPNNHYNAAAFNASGLNDTLSPEPSAFGTYPTTEFGGHDNGNPFFQSIEASQAPAFQQLRNHPFRRSVSEPPGGPGMPPPPPQPHPQQPSMTFHRDNHCLGEAMKPVPLKSQPKNRALRRHPYPQQKMMMRSGYEQPRPEHRRAQTQPIQHYAPTSAPIPMQMQHQFMPPAMMQGHPYVSSRVCSPSPGAAMVQSPPNMIDPALSQPPTPSKVSHQSMEKPANTVSIPLTVEELRSMIFEAVQQAVGGGSGERKRSPSKEESMVATGPAEVVVTKEESMVDEFINDQ